MENYRQVRGNLTEFFDRRFDTVNFVSSENKVANLDELVCLLVKLSGKKRALTGD